MDTTNKVAFPSIKDVPTEAWQKLSQKKIYFGHQSVGQDILDGIRDVMQDNPQIRINITKISNSALPTIKGFTHSEIGRNEDPISKCDDFSKILDNGIGEKMDYAFFKFCFVDITERTDVEKLFYIYESTLISLKKKYPQTTFVHVTAPLTTIQTGPKVWIKKLIGRPIGGHDDNIKRNVFNQKIRKSYAGKEPIFDIAKIESTFTDGSVAVFKKDNQLYPYLVTTYSDDGGHLNQLGRKRVAEQLLIVLANSVNNN